MTDQSADKVTSAASNHRLPWMLYHARALGARIGRGVACTPCPR
ncbi:hypothetical protein [Rhodococcus sp. T2V]|nr:hypothetical protein [Rhodococcus sp. T2V]